MLYASQIKVVFTLTTIFDVFHLGRILWIISNTPSRILAGFTEKLTSKISMLGSTQQQNYFFCPIYKDAFKFGPGDHTQTQ